MIAGGHPDKDGKVWSDSLSALKKGQLADVAKLATAMFTSNDVDGDEIQKRGNNLEEDQIISVCCDALSKLFNWLGQ